MLRYNYIFAHLELRIEYAHDLKKFTFELRLIQKSFSAV